MPGVPHVLWLSLGLLGGTTVLDSRFADYQWNVNPRPLVGLQALAGRGPLGAGLRVSQSRTTQTVGIPDPASAAAVHATSVEAVGQFRLVKAAGFEMFASASGGRMHLGYHPDRVAFQPGGTGSTVTVDFAPVDTWIGGGGIALRRRLAGAWSAGLGVDARVFSMDTAHRSGAGIVTERQSFGDWNARVELAWLLLGA